MPVRTLLALLSGCALAAAAPPPASLGVATSAGEFRLNSSTVRGNATLTEGAVLETIGASSTLRLASGAHLQLDSGSRARIESGGRVIVESGGGEWRANASRAALEAVTLRIASAEAGSVARFRIAGPASTLQLAAARGAFRVLNAEGTLISRLAPGVALAFEPAQARPAGAAAPSSFIGCVVRKEGKFMLFEPSLNLLVELRGQASAVEREWGNRVQANGTSPAATQQPEGRQLMNVTTITRIEVGGCQELAQFAKAEVPGGGATPSGSAPSTAGSTSTPRPPITGGGGGGEGMSAGTKYAIIAAVAGGGAVAGIAAAGGQRSR